MSSLWKTWAQLQSDTKGRKVFLYGRSEDWVHKAVKGLGTKIAGIIDRDTAYHGKFYRGLPVLPIEKVNHSADVFFIITAGDFGGIIERLEELGYKSGIDFACSPDFRDYEVLGRLKNFSQKVLISSSDYNDRKRARSSWLGGGLYMVDTGTEEFDRVAEGSFRQFEKLGDGHIAAVDYVDKKLVVFTPDFKIDHSINLDLPNYCGLSVCDQTGNTTIVNAGSDEILTYDSKNWTLLHRRKLRFGSHKYNHHLNDCAYYEGVLYVSYFSFSGNYKIDVFDGGVASVDPLTDQDPEPILKGLWKPHTPRFFDGKLYALDSMTGRLVSGKTNFKAKFPGFVRGMDKSLQYFVIGQSEDMYVSERMNIETVMLNAGIYIYDVEYNASRFIQTSGLMNIHDVKIWDN